MDFPNKEIADHFLSWWIDSGTDQHHEYRENKELPSLEDYYVHKTLAIHFKEESE